MIYDELVEVVARALSMSELGTTDHWDAYVASSKVAIETIRETLEVDTEEMINAAEMYSYQGYPKGYGGLWRAMLAASPLGEKKG